MAKPFANAVAVVTGGASGIGRALCGELCRRGAIVVVADINAAAAQRAAAELIATGGRAQAAALDVTDPQRVQQLVAEIAAQHGRIDFFFNNAAATATRGELRDLPLDPWHRAIDVNLFGVVHGTTAAYEQMIRQGRGHIVNIGSIAGLVGFPTSIPYGASKAAVVNLSLALRAEAADLGVRVSVVCPGPVHGDQPGRLRLMGVERAAERILAGVARDRAVIVFPFTARLLWWIYRLSPSFILPIGRRIVRSRRRRLAATRPAIGIFHGDGERTNRAA